MNVELNFCSIGLGVIFWTFAGEGVESELALGGVGMERESETEGGVMVGGEGVVVGRGE